MILQALVRYYEDMEAQGKISRPGWALAKVSFALRINEEGELLQVMPLKAPQQLGKKEVLMPRPMTVPAPVKRAVGIEANFLCDNAMYFLGLDSKGNAARAANCFDACAALHEQLLANAACPAGRAICAFFAQWKPEYAQTHPALTDFLEELKGGGNLVFMVGADFAQENPEVRQAWQRHYDTAGDGAEMQCLVTGGKGLVARLHPSLKGVRGAQTMGASLVSFNATAFESYGREQGFNAPVSEYAAFAYTTALNQLLADRNHTQLVGDTTVVYWAEGGQQVYQDLYADFFGSGEQTALSDADLSRMLRALAHGEPVDADGIPVSPEKRFYVLGLSPNAARLSIRFFLQDNFGAMLGHLQAHYDRLDIVKSHNSQWERLPLWALLNETVNQNARDKSPSPQLAGDTLRAILTGGRYPATLINAVNLRIRAEHEITGGRAAIIKAYLLRNAENDKFREVLTVELNEESCYPPYVLGRMFAVLEGIQQAANPGINATIRDKYLSSACGTPAMIFPVLLNLADKHLRKLDTGNRIYHERQLVELAGRLTASFPAHLTLEEQGVFRLGYYHQTQKRYQKKTTEEEK